MIDFNLMKIKLSNFVCYIDETIEFDNSNDDKNIFLIKMRNGTGKTSLFHAIKWVFYGEKGTRFFKDSQEIFVNDFLNDKTKENYFFVEILFRYGEDRYTLKRSYDIKDKKKESRIILIKNEREEFSDEQAQEKLDFIMPKNFSDFFMFDGEQLSRFMSAQKELHFRDSIEQLLGLKQLRVLKEDLETLQNDSERDLVKLNTTNTHVKAKNSTIEALKRDMDSNNIKISNKKAKIDENDEFIKVYESKQESYSGQLEIQTALNSLKDKKGTISDKLTKIKQKIIDYNQNLFTIFIESDLRDYIKENNNRLKELAEVCGLTEKEAQSHAGKKDILSRSVPKCGICKHVLSKSEKTEIKKELGLIEKNLDLFKLNKEESNSLKNENNLFEQFINNADNMDYIGYFDELADTLQKYKDINLKINNLDKKTQSELLGDYGEISRRLQRLHDENTMLLSEIKLLLAQNEGLNDNKKSIMKDIAKLGHDDKLISSTAIRSSYISNLIDNLDKSLDMSKDKKRLQIITESNRLFLEITNKSDEFKCIEFEDDKRYSFIIRATDNRIVKNPSKGEKQVLAMSFLLGLSQYTGRRNVIVMDTPVTSLDDIHATGVGKALSKLNNQVIFLAQPQELKGEIYNSIKDAVVREYEGRRENHQTYVD